MYRFLSWQLLLLKCYLLLQEGYQPECRHLSGSLECQVASVFQADWVSLLPLWVGLAGTALRMRLSTEA